MCDNSRTIDQAPGVTPPVVETQHGTTAVRRRKPRFSNACHRCKLKKLKCQFVGQNQVKCRACDRANSTCVFDVTPDGVPRGAAYIATLEAQVATLQQELNESRTRSSGQSRASATPVSSETHRDDEVYEPRGNDERCNQPRGSITFTELFESYVLPREPIIASPGSDINHFNMLQAAPTSSVSELPSTLPTLPSDQVANRLLEAAYLYTQARYCMIDWIQLRRWHHQRHSICFAEKGDDVKKQTGAYFIWIVYAIGAQFSPNPEHSSIAYFERARPYIHAVLSKQDKIAGSSNPDTVFIPGTGRRFVRVRQLRQLAGIALRLCIELGYHRSATVTRGASSLYEIELRRRFFWCAYTYDRHISYISKRPFGIAEFDIDVEIPLEIDLTCTDDDIILKLQDTRSSQVQAARGVRVTTEMSSFLHQLWLDRIKSKVMTRFTSPGALPPSADEIWTLLAELDEWRQQAPPRHPTPIPQHSDEQVHAISLQVALLLLRPVLSQDIVDLDVLKRCADLSATACENVKALSLSPQSHTSPIQVYHCFNCGISLLQCLAHDPKILPSRQVGRAIVACSSALAICTRNLASTSVFLELFDRLSDSFLGEVGNTESSQILSLQGVLREIIRSAPADMPGILRSLQEGESTAAEAQGEVIPSMEARENLMDNSVSTLHTVDMTESFDLFYDMSLFLDDSNHVPGLDQYHFFV